MTIERHPITDRAAWLALRQHDLTASDLAAVAGLDPYGRTAWQVWAQKAGLASGQEENSAMKLGRWLEPSLPCALLDSHPRRFGIRYPLDQYVRDPLLRLGGTPDADGTDGETSCVFEFKVISSASYERSWPGGEPPIGYLLQTLCNAMLIDADKGLLAALVLGWQDAELVLVDVARHAGAEERIRDLARRFWAAFDEGHALAAPDYERDAEAIRQVFKPDPARPAPIDLTGDNRLVELLNTRDGLKTVVRASEAELKAIDAEVIHKLGGATSATVPGWKITNTMHHRDEHVQKASDYPVLRISREKEKAA